MLEIKTININELDDFRVGPQLAEVELVSDLEGMIVPGELGQYALLLGLAPQEVELPVETYIEPVEPGVFEVKNLVATIVRTHPSRIPGNLPVHERDQTDNDRVRYVSGKLKPGAKLDILKFSELLTAA